MPRLQRLSPRHRRAIALRVGGQSPQIIADALGVRRRTVYIWFSMPLVKAELDRRVAAVDRLVNEQLAAQACRRAVEDQDGPYE